MEGLNSTKGFRHFCVMLILSFATGLLPLPAVYADAYAGSSGLAENFSWQKTMDRHVLLDAAYGKGIIAAVGEDGTIKISSDGEIFSLGGQTDAALQSVTWGDGKFIAVGSLGRILISEDGRTWRTVSSDTVSDLKDVTWNGSVFVVVGERGTLLVSQTGSSWSKITLDREYSFAEVISGNGRLILTTSDTFNYIFISDNGTSWKKVSPYGDHYGYFNTAYNGTKYIMYGKIPHQDGAVLLESGDGEHWSLIQNAPRAGSIAAFRNGFAGLGYGHSQPLGLRWISPSADCFT